MNRDITEPPAFQEQHNAAMQRMFFALVTHLHQRGAIDAPTLAGEIESGLAFGQAAYREQTNPVAQGLAQALRAIADAIDQSK